MQGRYGSSFVAWIAVTKMQVVHSDGSLEDVEDARDYIAMHVYNNTNAGQKVLEDRGCIQRSIYSSAQTIMLYL